MAFQPLQHNWKAFPKGIDVEGRDLHTAGGILTEPVRRNNSLSAKTPRPATGAIRLQAVDLTLRRDSSRRLCHRGHLVPRCVLQFILHRPDLVGGIIGGPLRLLHLGMNGFFLRLDLGFCLFLFRLGVGLRLLLLRFGLVPLRLLLAFC